MSLALKKSEVRRLVIAAAGLAGFSENAQILDHLGYVQIDAISVIERAHHHIFWNRNLNYSPEDLNELLSQRQAFEYWGHAASYLPLKDYRHYISTMQSFVSRSSWGRQRLEKYGHLLPDIKARIKDEGPLKASDFKNAPNSQSNGWWNWKPAKIALELLYWQGEIMVTKREGFHKVYDLKERFLPTSLDVSLPEPEETARFCVHRALQAHGVISFKQMTQYLKLVSKTHLKSALEAEVASGNVQAVAIEGLTETYYMASKSVASSPNSIFPKQTAILSPFDPLIIQRQRLKDLFDFTYIFEAYVPKLKRQHGYFVLPVLQGDTFVGRLDCKTHRKTSTLEVIRWIPESQNFCKESLQQAIASFATFNKCETTIGDTL